jgi:hypothetical protein
VLAWCTPFTGLPPEYSATLFHLEIQLLIPQRYLSLMFFEGIYVPSWKLVLKHSLFSLHSIHQLCECPPLTLLFLELEIQFTREHLRLLNALLAKLYRIFNNFVSLCLLLHSSSSNVSRNLEDPLESVNVLVCPPGTIFSDSKEFRYALLVLAIEFPILCCALLAQPKEPRTIQQLSN